MRKYLLITLALMLLLTGCSASVTRSVSDVTYQAPKNLTVVEGSDPNSEFINLYNDPATEEGCLNNERGSFFIQVDKMTAGLTDEELSQYLSDAMEKAIARFTDSDETNAVAVRQDTDGFLGCPGFSFTIETYDEDGQLFREQHCTDFIYKDHRYTFTYYTFPQCQDEATLAETQAILTGIVNSIKLK